MNGSDLHILVIPTWYPGGSDQLLGMGTFPDAGCVGK